MTCPVLLLRLLFNAKQAEQPVQQRPVSGLGHEQYQRAVQRLRLPLGHRCTFYLTGFTASHHPNAFDPVKAIFFLHCLLVLPGIRASVCNRKLISRPYRLHRLHVCGNVFCVRFKVEITAGYADSASAVHIRIKSVGGIRITKALLRNAENLPAAISILPPAVS